MVFSQRFWVTDADTWNKEMKQHFSILYFICPQIQDYNMEWKEWTLFSHSDNCRLTTICCTIVLSDTYIDWWCFELAYIQVKLYMMYLDIGHSSLKGVWVHKFEVLINIKRSHAELVAIANWQCCDANSVVKLWSYNWCQSLPHVTKLFTLYFEVLCKHRLIGHNNSKLSNR